MHSDKKAKVVYVVHRSVSPLFLLTLLFVGLKLGGCIAWPWWAVLAPTWLPFALAYGFVGGTLMVMAFVAFVAAMIALIGKDKW